MKASLYVSCALGLLLQCTLGLANTTSAEVALSMPEQPMRDALNGLARQTGLQVIYTAEDVTAGLVAPKIEGTFTPEAALSLLLKNTGLHFQFINPRTVAVTQTQTSPEKASADNAPGSYPETAMRSIQLRNDDITADPAPRGRFTLAQVGGGSARAAAPADQAAADSSKTAKQDDQTMVVTGSSIRGATNTASPMISFDREDILNSGVSSTHQFIQTLPQNFGGGYSETTIGSILGGEGSNLNYGQASGANLRGMGNDATLTLLNGRRVAPTSVGEAVDLSVIPLSAIERIDVLTDGASAIYGSDAVAGVVNIILRQNYDGAEVHARFGDVTDGSNSEKKAGMTYGHDWGSGSALVSYEYVDREQLAVNERSFTENALYTGVELVPPNLQNTFLLSMTQNVAGNTRMVGSAVYSKRSTVSTYFSGANVRTPIKTDQLSTSLSFLTDIGHGWQTDIGGSFSKNRTQYTVFQDGTFGGDVDQHNNIWAIDAKADGGVFSMAGGEAKLAVGAQYRRDGFSNLGSSGGTTDGEIDRNVTALSTELLLPFVSASNARPGMRRFEVSIAGRYEDYSDVGSSTDPKVGILWSPGAGVSVRGTYGTSFRAPTAYESSTVALPLTPGVYQLPDPANGGVSNAIVLYGNTGTLKPEESTNWTVGLDIKPESMPGLAIALTYFDIDFTNRVAEPLSVSSAFFNALIDEAQHPNIIDRNPALATVQAYFANPNFFSFVPGVTPADIDVIVDNQRTNVASTVETGIDLNVTYDMDTSIGVFTYGLSVAHLFEKKNELTPGSPLLEAMNALFQPVDMKARASLSWAHNHFANSLFLNYVGSYRDTRPGFERPVSSWTTVDLTSRYAFSTGAMQGVSLAFAANNVLDQDPPFISYFGFNYDGSNASAVGRYLSMTVTKEW